MRHGHDVRCDDALVISMEAHARIAFFRVFREAIFDSMLCPMWIRQRLIPIFVLICALAACKRGPRGPEGVPVTVTKPEVREVTEWDEFTGRLEPIKSVEVRARVSGQLESVHFKDGQEVKVGDLLFVIDPRPYQAEVDRARAEMKQAEANRNLAALNFQRAQKLVDAKTIAVEQYDHRRNEYESAVADVARTDAMLKTATLNLEFAHVRAPIGGQVSRTYVHEGNFVTGGSAQGTLLTTIVPSNPLYAYFDIDERTVLKYSRLHMTGERTSSRDFATPVKVALSDEKEFTHHGTVDFVDNRIDPATGTLRIRATIDNSDGLLTPGLFVRIRLQGKGPYKTLLIPDDVIGTDQSRKFVMVVADDSTAQRRFVTPGRLYDGMRSIDEGLNAGDWVIVGGLMRVRPGDKVAAKEREGEKDL